MVSIYFEQYISETYSVANQGVCDNIHENEEDLGKGRGRLHPHSIYVDTDTCLYDFSSFIV